MRPKPLIAFAGTPDFAVPALSALLSMPAELTLVLTQPDRPAGRGRALRRSPVKREAQAHGLRLRQPAALHGQSALTDWGPAPDLLVVVAYGLLLPQWLLDWPKLGAVNVHASLLPRWRGAAPIQRAILAGDRRTGVSIMRMVRGMDEGPVYASRALDIGARESAGQLHDRLAALGAALLIETLPGVLDGSRSATPQDHAAATYAPKVSKAEAALDWRRSAEALARFVRAFNPWPVCEASTSDGRRLRIWEACALGEATTRPPGSIVAASRDGIDVATGDGILRLLAVQAPSGRVMSAAAYLAAHPLEGGSFAA